MLLKLVKPESLRDGKILCLISSQIYRVLLYVYPNAHAGYYLGARPIAMKVLFRRSDGRLLSAQALGLDGVDKRISALAMAIQMGATIYDIWL